MKRFAIMLMTMTVTLFGIWWAFGAAVGGPTGEAVSPAGMPVAVTPAEVRFVPVDVFLDTGTRALGSYQFEVMAKGATIVGLEGGEAAAFRGAPFYDPDALARGNRLIVAAFSTDDKLPSGATRVARLHVMVTGAGDGVTNLTGKLVVATNPDGQRVDATLQLRAGATTTQGAKR